MKNKDWKDLIEKKLSPDKTIENLIWKSHEGIEVNPFYDEVKKNSKALLIPKEWKAISDYFPTDEWGVECLNYDTYSGEEIPKYIETFFTKDFSSAVKLNKANRDFYFLFAPLTELAKNGYWQTNQKEDLENWGINIDHFTKKKSISIDIGLFQNAGMKIFHQIAVGLLMAKEYIEIYGEKIIPQLFLDVSVGANLYFEIAKIKSIRFLFEKLFSAYGYNEPIKIIAKDSIRNKTFIDPENNLVRSTLQAVSAIFGGADFTYINPYNAISNNKDSISRELAYKQLLVLKQECNLSTFFDPTQNAYYIENLVNEMSEKSWVIFLEWENKGGYLELLANNFIGDLVNAHHKEEQKLFDDKKIIQIGVNQYANSNFIKLEKKQEIDKSKIEFTPIIEKRWAEKIETN